MRTRWMAGLLLLVLLFSLVACGPAAAPIPPSPSDEGGDLPTGGDPLTLSVKAPSYAVLGETVRLTLSGTALVPEDTTFTYDGTATAEVPYWKEGTCYLKVTGAGLLTITAACGDVTGTCTLTVLPENVTYTQDAPEITYLGRTDENGNSRIFRNTASGFSVTFYGKTLTAHLQNTKGATRMAVMVDGEDDPTQNILDLTKGGKEGQFVLASFRRAGLHTVRVQKLTEESITTAALTALSVAGGALVMPEPTDALKIEVYGDSITCGYGNMRTDGAIDGLYPATQNGLMTYATIAARRLGAECSIFARSGIGLYTNAHKIKANMVDVYNRVSPESDATALWDMAAHRPDVVVINLGTNDGGAGPNNTDGQNNVPYTPEGMQAAYETFVRQLDAAYGEGVLYLLVGGMMTNYTNPQMQAAAQRLRAEGLSVYVVDLPAREGYQGHPLLDVHQEAADVLWRAIRDYTK